MEGGFEGLDKDSGSITLEPAFLFMERSLYQRGCSDSEKENLPNALQQLLGCQKKSEDETKSKK